MVDGLGPGAGDVLFFEEFTFPSAVTAVGVEVGVLVGPVLPPVFHDHGALLFAVFVFEVHDESVLEGDDVVVVFEDADFFGAPGEVGAGWGVVVGEADCFHELETDAELSGHGEDGAAVVFEGGVTVFGESGPFGRRFGVEGDFGAGGGAAAVGHLLGFQEGPGEGEGVGGFFGGGFLGLGEEERGGEEDEGEGLHGK